MNLDPEVTPTLSFVPRPPSLQDGAKVRGRARQQPRDMGMEEEGGEDDRMDDVLPPRSLITSALDTWDEMKNAIYGRLCSWHLWGLTWSP